MDNAPRLWPALDIAGDTDRVLAEIDEFAPTALEEHDATVRVFFATPEQRDAAQTHLAALRVPALAIDVSDENWAARSQQNLTPITIGRITIVPDPSARDRDVPARAPTSGEAGLAIVIEPSMGFGTGHHATTRMCLEALQTLDVRGSVVLDAGTGSGILAIAASRLGAAAVFAIDIDADAIRSARSNLTLNPRARVTVALVDLTSLAMPPADIVLANLTGATLARSAAGLVGCLRPGGMLVASGILASEEHEVRGAFEAMELNRRAQDSEWICLTMKKA